MTTYTHTYLAALARHMADTGATAEEVAYAMEKPAKHADEAMDAGLTLGPVDERAETKRLRDAIHDEAVLLSRHAVAARAAELHDEAELAGATAFRLRAALAAPTPEETP